MRRFARLYAKHDKRFVRAEVNTLDEMIAVISIVGFRRRPHVKQLLFNSMSS